jgi:hypothetical protein
LGSHAAPAGDQAGRRCSRSDRSARNGRDGHTYREDVAKVALVNPADLAMLEESHELIEALGALDTEPLSDVALKSLRAEDPPRPGRARRRAPKSARTRVASSHTNWNFFGTLATRSPTRLTKKPSDYQGVSS